MHQLQASANTLTGWAMPMIQKKPNECLLLASVALSLTAWAPAARAESSVGFDAAGRGSDRPRRRRQPAPSGARHALWAAGERAFPQHAAPEPMDLQPAAAAFAWCRWGRL